MTAEHRVLIVGMEWHETRPGGLNRFVANVSESLRQAGSDVRVLVEGDATAAPAYVMSTAPSSGQRLVKLWRWRVAGIRACREFKPTIIDIHFALFGLPLLMSRIGRSTPVAVHFHGPWADEVRAEGHRSRIAHAVRRRIESATYRRADEIITISASFKQLLVERYGVNPHRVRVVPPGVDLTRFVPADQRVARTRLGVRHDAPVVASVRRLVARTGVDVLLDAWAKLDNEEAVLLIAGTGAAESALREQAAALDLGPGVRFLGAVSDDVVCACYSAADVTVVSSLALEGFGLVLIESLASGTPVIASRLDGIVEVLEPFEPRLLIPPGDSDLLAQRLAEALDQPHSLPGRERCRSYAETFGWREATTATLQAFDDAQQSRDARAPQVVFVDHAAVCSGGELAMVRLIRALGPKIRPYVILGKTGPLEKVLGQEGIPYEVFSFGRASLRGRFASARVQDVLASANTAARLARRLRMLKPDVVHTNSLKAAAIGGLAARLAGVPLVWHVRDILDRDHMSRAGANQLRALGKVLPHAVIANSLATLESLGARRPPGYSISSPVPEPALVASLRANGTLRIGIVGRLAEWKGQALFIDAFAAAFPDGGARGVIIGDALFDADTDFRDQLVHRIQELGLSNRVDMTGHVDDVYAAMSGLDILVHASMIAEPFGQVVVEGMAMGLPVIATRAGGPAEIIRHGFDGLLVPPGDVQSMVSAMRRLAGDPVLRVELGSRARRSAARYRPNSVAERVLLVYDSLTSDPGGSECVDS